MGTLGGTGMRVTMVDPKTARAWVEAGEAVVVDVREPHEYAAAHLAGATLVPLSAFDPSAIPPHEGKKLLLHCAVGVRCGVAADVLARVGGFPELYRLAGGLKAWIEDGGPVIADR